MDKTIIHGLIFLSLMQKKMKEAKQKQDEMTKEKNLIILTFIIVLVISVVFILIVLKLLHCGAYIDYFLITSTL